ncbi:MAG: DUF6702 family protein [Planctomycetota bacterium]
MCLFAYGCLLSGLLLHPSLETVTELQWNADSGRVECALRLSLIDEQDVLRDSRQRWNMSNQENARKRWDPILIKRVLATSIRFNEADPDRSRVTAVPTSGKERSDQESTSRRFHFIGRQADGGHVWWFFEYEPPASDNGAAEPPSSVRIEVLDRIASVHTHRSSATSLSGETNAKTGNLTVPRNAIRVLGDTAPWVVTAAGSTSVSLVWPGQEK